MCCFGMSISIVCSKVLLKNEDLRSWPAHGEGWGSRGATTTRKLSGSVSPTTPPPGSPLPNSPSPCFLCPGVTGLLFRKQLLKQSYFEQDLTL